jgi:TetR/AcrR family transcriptional regulator, transcriptional repressor for nem operon
MKVSREQAEQNRQSLIDTASRLYRECGLDGIGVAQIAEEAGLTHGGFYRHFDSKETFAAEACERAFEKSLNTLRNIEPGDGTAFTRYIKGYLSESNRDSMATGCPVAALAVDAARKKGPLAHAIADGIAQYIELFAERLQAEEEAERRKSDYRVEGIATLAVMVGGLVLSRAVATANPRLSRQILTSLRNRVGKQTAADAA